MSKQVPQSLQSRLHHLSKLCLNLLFPPLCVSCQRPGDYLCSACAQKVEPIGPSICARCGKIQRQPTAACPACQQMVDWPLQLIRAAARHAGPLRQGIHHLKYENCPELAPLLARYLTVEFAQPHWCAVHATLDAVAPVPLHQDHLAERGYNQSELLAVAFCQQMQLPLYADWIERARATRSQVGLDAWERQDNVKDAFVASHQVENKTILLIDDVYTTGATLHACAAAALAAGAAAVYGLAVAAPVHVN